MKLISYIKLKNNKLAIGTLNQIMSGFDVDKTDLNNELTEFNEFIGSPEYKNWQMEE